MSEEHLPDLLARLERERTEADRFYNEALTALDRALQRVPPMPHPPPSYDESVLPSVNQTWQILPEGAPPIDRSLRGRLRGFIWRLVGPPLDRQGRFNAAIVDHLNRNAVAHREAQRAIATSIELVRLHVQGAVHFESLLIRYLQTVTAYVETRDRAAGGQLHVMNAALGAIADDWLKRWETLGAREARFQAAVTSLGTSLDDLRATASLAQQTSLTLKREVERLIAHGLPASTSGAARSGEPVLPAAEAGVDLNAFKYLGFEDAFRGSRDDIRQRLAAYAPLFAGQTDVLDLGCGRGEFLDLLREQGIRARGVDMNHEMVETARARGLEVAEGDALSVVAGLKDQSIGGAFAAQVVEHLQPEYLFALIEALFHKIRPGGVVVLETINPTCWLAFFESYIKDLSHVRPIHPDTLQYLLRASGFNRVEIVWKSPVPDAARLRLLPTPPLDADPAMHALIETLNGNAEKLNARMFTHQDYAAIARR